MTREVFVLIRKEVYDLTCGIVGGGRGRVWDDESDGVSRVPSCTGRPPGRPRGFARCGNPPVMRPARRSPASPPAGALPPGETAPAPRPASLRWRRSTCWPSTRPSGTRLENRWE